MSLETAQSPDFAKAKTAEPAAGAVLPNYEWKFLSASEKAAVDAALDTIRNQRIESVTFNILDESGKPYRGPVVVTQDSTSFIFLAGFNAASSVVPLYFTALTPSRSSYLWAAWHDVENSKGGAFAFTGPTYDYEQSEQAGMTDFHIELGPYFSPTPGWSMQPDWTKGMDYESFKAAMAKYVATTVSHFKGWVQNYHLWLEANMYYGNGNWPLQRIVDIIKMEADTVRATDPNAKIYVDLDNTGSGSLSYQPQGSNWTTEFFVQQLLAAGVQFDVIGIEPNIGEGEAARDGGVDTFYHRLIQLGALGKPLYVWEEGLESYIDPKYANQMRGDWWVGTWHGTPSEEKQAEFMTAEIIVALGNPNMKGMKFALLSDDPSDALFWHQYRGLLHSDGSPKPAFYAVQSLWRSLLVNITTQISDGSVEFMGLPGTYTVRVEGYKAVTIRVPEAGSNVKVSIALAREAMQQLQTTSLTNISVTKQTSQQRTSTVESMTFAAIGLAVVTAVTAFLLLHKRKSVQEKGNGQVSLLRRRLTGMAPYICRGLVEV
jgi:hypothetical protein